MSAIQLSYEEKILAALASIPHDERDGMIDKAKKRYIAVREVLKPLYAELEVLKVTAKSADEMLSLAGERIADLMQERFALIDASRKLAEERDAAKKHALECSLALERAQTALKEIQSQTRGYSE